MKKSINRFILPFLFSLLLSFRLAVPAYSQSSLNSCFTSPAAASECSSAGLISPQSAANAIRSAISTPSPLNPITTIPSKEAVLVLGGAAALAYLSQPNMQGLQDTAKGLYVPPFTGGQGIGVRYNVAIRTYATFTGQPEQDLYGRDFVYSVFGAVNGIQINKVPNGWNAILKSASPDLAVLSVGLGADSVRAIINSITRVDGQQDTGGNIQPSLVTAAGLLPNSSIYARSATSAAAASAALLANSASTDDSVLAAALAASAAAAFVSSDPLSSLSDKAIATAAATSAQASVDAIAATAAAKDTQAKDKALADKITPPAALPKKDFKVSTNFLTYAVTGFSTKFPFDIFFGGTDAIAPACPSFTLFYYKWEMCFLMPLFLSIRWIVTISLSVKIFLEL